MTVLTPDKATRLSRPILLAGFVLGLLLSFAVLSGDELGRVNLLYLLLIFLFIPLASAIVSIVSLIRGRGINLARLLSATPIWSKSQQTYLHKIRQMHLDKHWFFLQSQAAALAYSVAGVVTFILLLLATDINFVWRSTLLDAEDLYPLLKVVASIWPFWDSAQPTLELLQMTQDSRLTHSYSDIDQFGHWWAFILATQIVYSFFLRGALLFAGKVWLTAKLKKDVELQLSQKLDQHSHPVSTSHALEPITHQLPENYALSNWAGFSSELIDALKLTPTQTVSVDPLIMSEESTVSDQQLVLVKSWEPPMGELQDYLHQGRGLLFPIDLKSQTVKAPEQRHLEEWQRFVRTLPNWRIYRPTEWSHQDEP